MGCVKAPHPFQLPLNEGRSSWGLLRIPGSWELVAAHRPNLVKNRVATYSCGPQLKLWVAWTKTLSTSPDILPLGLLTHHPTLPRIQQKHLKGLLVRGGLTNKPTFQLWVRPPHPKQNDSYMTRVKRGFVARKRRKRILKLTKGFRGSHSVLYRTAQQRTLKSLSLSYRDRRQFKREVRKLWIRRINSGIRLIPQTQPINRVDSSVKKGSGQNSVAKNYSSFIHRLKKSNIELNRKILSQFAIFDPLSFHQVLKEAN